MNLETLKKYDMVYVIGHQKPDADTIFSSYLMTNIMLNMGINAKFTILKDGYDYALDEKDIINDYFKEQPYTLNNEETSNKNFFLVDHNRVFNSIKDGNVVGGIDHHFNPYHSYNNFLIEDYASTGACIYNNFKDIYTFSKYEKELIAITILMDTRFLRTTRFKKGDKEIFNELDVNFDINDMINKYFKTTDLTKDIDYNFNERFKAYEINNIIMNTTYVNALKSNRDYLDKYRNYMNSLDGDWILIWNEYDTLKTYVYIKDQNKDYYLEYDFIASRANDVVRDVKKLLFK